MFELCVHKSPGLRKPVLAKLHVKLILELSNIITFSVG